MTIHGFKTKLHTLTETHVFQMVVISAIIFSSLMAGLKTHPDSKLFTDSLAILDALITIFFVIELSVRMLGEPRLKDFFKSGWNNFDFIVVAVSLVPVGEGALVLRLVRIFRVLRIISISPSLQLIVGALLRAIPRAWSTIVLMFIIFYIYAVVGSILLGNVNPDRWEHIGVSLVTLFQIFTFDSWTELMIEAMEVHIWIWIYFLSFIFLNGFIFFNFMIGIVIESMAEEKEEQDKLNEEGHAGEMIALKRQLDAIEGKLDRVVSPLNDGSEKRTKIT